MHEGNIKFEIEYHHKDCYGWALHCCNGDREMAAEVLQTSYLKMLEKQHAVKGTSAFRTWAFTVIKNTAIDAGKKQKKSIRLVQSDGNPPDTAFETALESGFDQKLKILFFSEALNQLSERQRQILQLVFYHDTSLNQAAKVLNISQGSARKHYDRAKKALAGWFKKKGIENYND